MGLKLQNEFTVAAPLDETWATLLDIGRVARCMPGAKIEPGGDDGVYRGTMKMKLGPMTVAYKGTARLAEVDADAHVCVLDVKAKEQQGQGTAAAVITNRLAENGKGTRVIVETDLAITGRQAQFGRGIMEDVSSKMLTDFAQRLEREILAVPQAAEAAPAGPAPAAGAAISTPPPAAPSATPVDEAPDVLDLGGVVGGPVAKRAGAAAAAAALVAVIVWLLGRDRRSKGFELHLKYR